MKTKLFIIALTGFITLGLSIPTEAFSKPPYWAQAHGYRAQPRQIYYPDYNCYFDTQCRSYIYLDNGNWRVSVNLPSFVNRNSFRNARRVEFALNNFTPERYNREHMARYRSDRRDWNYNREYYNYNRTDRDNDRNEYNHWNKRNKERNHERNECYED
jgi:hypothetical protein